MPLEVAQSAYIENIATYSPLRGAYVGIVETFEAFAGDSVGSD